MGRLSDIDKCAADVSKAAEVPIAVSLLTVDNAAV